MSSWKTEVIPLRGHKVVTFPQGVWPVDITSNGVYMGNSADPARQPLVNWILAKTKGLTLNSLLKFSTNELKRYAKRLNHGVGLIKITRL